MPRRQLKSIPKPSHDVPRAIRLVFEPIIDAIESRFLGRNNSERAMTGEDLIELGLVTREQLNQLDVNS